MLSFIICLVLLIGGYFVYGNFVNNIFSPDDRETPAVRINDGVDYVVMPQWKLFLIQLLVRILQSLCPNRCHHKSGELQIGRAHV